MSERRASERVGRVAAVAAAGLLAVSGTFELSKPAAATAANRSAATAETAPTGKEIIARTDKHLRAFLKQINLLKNEKAKGVDIHTVKVDGLTLKQYSVAVPEKDFAGRTSYDIFAAIVDKNAIKPSAAGLPMMSLIIHGAATPNFGIKENYSASNVTMVGRSFFPQDVYTLQHFDPGNEFQPKYRLPMGKVAHIDRLQTEYDDYTSQANGIIEAAQAAVPSNPS